MSQDPVSRRVREAREAEGRSVQWMADRLGIHRNTYHQIESGKTELSVPCLKLISELTKRPIGWFVYGDDAAESIDERHRKEIAKIRKLLVALPPSIRSLFFKHAVESLEFLEQYIKHR